MFAILEHGYIQKKTTTADWSYKNSPNFFCDSLTELRVLLGELCPELSLLRVRGGSSATTDSESVVFCEERLRFRELAWLGRGTGASARVVVARDGTLGALWVAVIDEDDVAADSWDHVC